MSFATEHRQKRILAFMNRIFISGGAGSVWPAVARHIINDTPDAAHVLSGLYKMERLGTGE